MPFSVLRTFLDVCGHRVLQISRCMSFVDFGKDLGIRSIFDRRHTAYASDKSSEDVSGHIGLTRFALLECQSWPNRMRCLPSQQAVAQVEDDLH